MEVLRRWEELRLERGLSKVERRSLRNIEQEHHLLIDEVGAYEIVPIESLPSAAGGDPRMRAFTFTRAGRAYVLYWHARGRGELDIQTDMNDLILLNDLREPAISIRRSARSVTIPLQGVLYLAVDEGSAPHLHESIRTARIL